MEVKRTKTNRTLRARRTRIRARGTAARPRLSVHIGNRHVGAQIIDDASGKTLASVSTVGTKAKLGTNLSERAEWAGEQIAKAAAKANVKQVVFDRGAKLYHGRVAKLADAARKNGLEF